MDFEGYANRLGTQLAETRRLAQAGDPYRARLALLLADGAAETLLRRFARERTERADLFEPALAKVRSTGWVDKPTEELLSELEAVTVSRTRRRKIDRDFTVLVDFVREEAPEQLPAEVAAGIKVLHRYRNAAQHRDSIHMDVVGPAVKIYISLVCHLMEMRRGFWNPIASSEPVPQGVCEVLEVEQSEAAWGDLEKMMAIKLRADLELDPAALTETFRTHLEARLRDVAFNLDEIAAHLGWNVFGQDLAREAALRALQVTEEERTLPDPPADFWTRELPYTPEPLANMQEQAVELSCSPDGLEALACFARLEAELEPIEASIEVVAIDLDREVQREVDRRRGK